MTTFWKPKPYPFALPTPYATELAISAIPPTLLAPPVAVPEFAIEPIPEINEPIPDTPAAPPVALPEPKPQLTGAAPLGNPE